MQAADFSKAIQVAGARLNEFVPAATNPEVEEAILSRDNKLYEITFSYDVPPKQNLPGSLGEKNLAYITALMRQRREYKVFLVDAETLTFKGFRKYTEK